MAITQEFNGDILVDGNVSSDTITAIGAIINGELSANSANVSGAVSARSASITGALTANFLDTTGNANNQAMSQNATTIAINNAVANAVTNALNRAHPIGAIYISTVATSPASLFGGSWKVINNRFLYASGTYSVGATGGSETHTLNVKEIPMHGKHIPYGGESTSGGSAAGKFLAERAFDSYGNTGRGWNNLYNEYYPYTFEVGGNGAHNNMPPYLVVYMWQRTA